ncbi:MAG TPA: hypothetical protein DD381_02860 [Lentisphaeria bacterium]|nr:MAG: hypothetical protein A2X47_03395 [Lentisphaerae bacterium GWF2_38_69]HBM15275.1 hypothetical protein [Lentisphaeria bacterium]
MRKLKSLTIKVSLCLSLMLASNFTYAAFMQNWLKPFQGPGQNINLLIVTGNYSKSRMLAELIQSYNAQPVLLAPYVGENSGDDLFFVPPKKDGQSLRVPYTEMTNFINFVNPKMVLVLGGPEYVPDIYFKKIQENRTIIRLTGKDWIKTAESAGRLLNLTNLSRDYQKLIDELNSDTNYQRASSLKQHQTEVAGDAAAFDGTAPFEFSQDKVIDASEK